MQWQFFDQNEKGGGVGRLVLYGEVEISGISPLKEALQQAIDVGDSLVVDCSAIEAIDCSAMQLFCSAHRSAAAAGKSLRAENLMEGPLKVILSKVGFLRYKSCPLVPQGEPCLWVPAGPNDSRKF